MKKIKTDDTNMAAYLMATGAQFREIDGVYNGRVTFVIDGVSEIQQERYNSALFNVNVAKFVESRRHLVYMAKHTIASAEEA